MLSIIVSGGKIFQNKLFYIGEKTFNPSTDDRSIPESTLCLKKLRFKLSKYFYFLSKRFKVFPFFLKALVDFYGLISWAAGGLRSFLLAYCAIYIVYDEQNPYPAFTDEAKEFKVRFNYLFVL